MKNIFIFLFVSCGILFSCQANKQFVVQQARELSVNSFEPKPNIAFAKAVNYLPLNYSKSGNTDYTFYLQKALDENRNVQFPDFPVAINSKGLRLRSFSNIFFSPKSKIVSIPDTREIPDANEIKNWYDILKIYDIENVVIYNPTIVGDRKHNFGNVGEWGAGIAIKNSSNISIYNAAISDTWGDGIFIGSENEGVSRNILIKNSSVNFARRNGVSVTSVVNLQVINFLAANTYGTLPMSGFHIEPSLNSEEIKGVKILGLKTFNNSNSGLSINLNAFPTDDKVKRKKIDITITNHHDQQSGYGFSYSIDVTRRKYNPNGKIIYQNATIENTTFGPFWKTNGKKDVSIVIENINILDRKKNKKINFSDKNF